MTSMTRADHRDADLYESQSFPDGAWERATDDAAKLLLSDEAEFEKHVLAETGLDLLVPHAMLIVKNTLAGNEQMNLDVRDGRILLPAYNEAVDRLARRQLEGGR